MIGEWCNLGAGTTTSNIKNTAGNIRIGNTDESDHVSGIKKCGLLMGDYSRAAINTSFNTGTIVGVCCNIFTHDFPPRIVPNFSWGNELYDLEKAFKHIGNWKQLKGQSLSDVERKMLTDLYNKLNRKNA